MLFGVFASTPRHHRAATAKLGVTLRDAKGSCNGFKDGARYFECDANHGVFVDPTEVMLAEQWNFAMARLVERTRALGYGSTG